MTERRSEFARPTPDRNVTEGARSRVVTALFVVGLAVVAANSALYFFSVESFSHPAISVLGLGLLVPKYLRER